MGTSRGQIAKKIIESFGNKKMISDNELRNAISMMGAGNPKSIVEYMKMMVSLGWIKEAINFKWEILYERE